MAKKVMIYNQEKAMGAKHSCFLCAILFNLSMKNRATSVEKVKVLLYMLA